MTQRQMSQHHEADPVASGALFERDGSYVVPTELARGPWRPDGLHGGAVAALLASAIDLPGRTPVRVTFDLLAPVPCAPLTLVVSAPEGGQRTARQTVSLLHEGREVARAQCLGILHADLDLPDLPVALPNPFDGAPVPELDRTRPVVARNVGWECFDSGAVAVRRLKEGAPDHATALYLNLLVPVIAGEPIRSISRAAAAADYASNHIAYRLDFDRWSFMNADLTLHLSRVPAQTWIGLVSTGVAAPNGSGLSIAQLFDGEGRLGQSVQSLVLEARQRVDAGASRG